MTKYCGHFWNMCFYSNVNVTCIFHNHLDEIILKLKNMFLIKHIILGLLMCHHNYSSTSKVSLNLCHNAIACINCNWLLWLTHLIVIMTHEISSLLFFYFHHSHCIICIVKWVQWVVIAFVMYFLHSNNNFIAIVIYFSYNALLLLLLLFFFGTSLKMYMWFGDQFPPFPYIKRVGWVSKSVFNQNQNPHSK